METLPPVGEKGGFPFLDFGNVVMQDGASYDPGVLTSLTAQQIADQLDNPHSSVAEAEDGAENYLTAGICAMTNNDPQRVCSVPYVQTAERRAGI
ncbi:MAG: hypothetical protein WAM97_08255 [Acidimicrobiales bacterium]